MVEELLKSGRIMGMTKSEVREHLGDDDTVASSGKFPEWDLIYWVGRERAIGIDSEWLGLRLGPDSRVSAYELVED